MAAMRNSMVAIARFMEKNIQRCVSCFQDFELPSGYKFNLCEKCTTPKEIGIPACIDYTNDYVKHGLGKQLKSRLKEMSRRTILPYEPEKGSDENYYVGRRGENGKIQERVPNYQG